MCASVNERFKFKLKFFLKQSIFKATKAYNSTHKSTHTIQLTLTNTQDSRFDWINQVYLKTYHLYKIIKLSLLLYLCCKNNFFNDKRE